MRTSIESRRRSGTAIVAALALVMLAGALLASAASVVSSGARAALSERAALAVEGEARRALATTLERWDATCDSLAIGSAKSADLVAASPDSAAGFAIEGRVAIRRLALRLYAITVDARVAGSQPLARRRIRLLVKRDVPADSTLALPAPHPIVSWPMADLY